MEDFTRGHHPLFMDWIVELTQKVVSYSGTPVDDIPRAEEIRPAMGVTAQGGQASFAGKDAALARTLFQWLLPQRARPDSM